MTSNREDLRKLRRFLSVDRLGIQPLPLERGWPRTGIRACVWALIVGLWAVGFGEATIAAVRVLLGIPYQPPVFDDSAASIGRQVERLLEAVAFATAAGLVLAFLISLPRYVGIRQPEQRTGRLVAGALSIPFASIASEVGFGVVLLIDVIAALPLQGYPNITYNGPQSEVLRLALSAMAGPTEELALLGVVVVGLRRVGYSWTVVCITAVAVRVPFHLYYGWGAIGLAAWVLLLVLTYRRTGTLWGLILEHALWDVTVDIGPAAQMIRVAAMGTAAAVIAMVILMRNRPPSTSTTPDYSDTTPSL